MTAFADLILPDTTYLERHDCMSLLDRPISEFDGPVDSVRIPVLPPTGQCKPFQEVIVELAGRLKLPAFVHADGSRKFRDYPDFIVNYETARFRHRLPRRLARQGRREGDARRAEPRQWEMYAQNNCVFQVHMPAQIQYMRNWNRDYMAWAQANGLRRDNDPIVIHLYSSSCSASASRRRASTRASSRRRACASAWRPTSTRCRSTTRRWKNRPPTPRATR